MTHRVGLGTDCHRLGADRPLVVGGVEVLQSGGAHAHSDGDVALHALTDALLGAIAQGDIGELFPDDQLENRDRASADFVQEALRRVNASGREPVNVDIVVHLQEPKLLPFRDLVRKNVAALLALPEDCVAFKAKTGESVGPVGEGLTIEATAIVLLKSTT